MENIISEEHLRNLGYTREEWTEKDSPSDEFDTLKHVVFKKHINEDFSINIVWFYEAKEPNAFELKKNYAELEAGGECLPIKLDLYLIEHIYSIFSGDYSKIGRAFSCPKCGHIVNLDY